MKQAVFIVLLCWPSLVFAQQSITVEGRKFDNVQALHDFLTQRVPDERGVDRYQDQQVKAAALLEYAKLDPKGAREIALAEMANSDPNVAVQGLLFLKDEEIPELTDAFRANLKADSFCWHLACVERYGSAELLPDVVRLYEGHKGEWACEIAARCLGFIVKQDRARGLQLTEEALSLREGTGCFHDVVRDVLVAYPGQDVLALSLKYIGDKDDAVSTNAAYVVSRQVGGKEKLRTILTTQTHRLSDRTRSYIESQLLSAPN
jgi:hypothetical protein